MRKSFCSKNEILCKLDEAAAHLSPIFHAVHVRIKLYKL